MVQVSVEHGEWVKTKLSSYSLKLGFRYVPREEIEQRMGRVRALMRKESIEALIVVEKMDLYYLAGTAQDGLLYLPLEGKPVLMIRRELDRAKIESPIENVVGLLSLREIPSVILQASGRVPTSLGLELDVLPVKDYLRYQELFPRTKLRDSSKIMRDARKIKSSFEIGLMKEAGRIGSKVYEEAQKILREGMSEIEFGGLLEAVAKRYGHEGLLRIRSLNYEAYSWHILSGWSGGIVSQADSPVGGLGLSPAFPVGASRKQIIAHEPILVDFGICYHGYQTDQTRIFSIQRLKEKFQSAYRVCLEIHDAVLDELRPGAVCEEIYWKALRLADQLGYGEVYLGPPGLKTRFVGHGIGLELNEFPFLAPGHDYPVEAGMTLAVEPKMVFPGEGTVGIEDTVVVKDSGVEILTPIERSIFEVS